MKLAPLLVFLICFAGGVRAETDPAVAARGAADLLEDATRQLDGAKTARDRVKALTKTVQGFEAGLAAMRDGLRAVSIREATLSRELQAREEEISRLLGVLQSIGNSPAPTLLLHPSGPTGTARSGMLLADVTPGLHARTEALRNDLEELTTLRQLQQDAAARLQEGMVGVQQARTALSKAVADRKDLPRRFTEDPIQTAVLIAATETLEGFASGLSEISENEVTGDLPDISSRRGQLPMPVQGRVLRRAGEEDASGIARPGIVVATRPRALVTTPVAATVRYRGPLLDYGQVSVLEPQAGMLIVLSGLDVVYGEPGQVLPATSPVGLMGGSDPDVGTILSQNGDGSGADLTETLYIEIRQGTDPEDPLSWFLTEKDG